MPGSGKDNYNFVFDESLGVWRRQPYAAPSSGSVGGGGWGNALGLSELVGLTTISGGVVHVSQVIDQPLVDNEVTFIIDFAPLTTSTPGAGTEFRIEASEKASGDDTWVALAAFRTGITAAATFTTQDENPGQTVLEAGTTPAWAANDQIFLRNVADFANSEFGRVSAISTNVSVTVIDPLTSTQESSVAFNQCFHFVATVEMKSLQRLRVVAANNLHANSYWSAWRCAIIENSNV